MRTETQIDMLIEAGWQIVKGDIRENAFQEWRREVLKCLTCLCGADHHYTDFFTSKVLEAGKRNVLAGLGVLAAARLGRIAEDPAEYVKDLDVPALDSIPRRVQCETLSGAGESEPSD